MGNIIRGEYIDLWNKLRRCCTYAQDYVGKYDGMVVDRDQQGDEQSNGGRIEERSWVEVGRDLEEVAF